MKPLVEANEYQKSIYRMFGMFPFLLLIVACIVAYAVSAALTVNATGTLDPLEPKLLADAFFRGVVGTVVLFYIARLGSIRSSDKSVHLKDMDEAGYYITCMSHNKWSDLTFGNLIITQRRLYFQPDKQMSMELAFDHKDYDGFTVEMGPEMKSVGLFLMTGKKQMVDFKDRSGRVVGTFIIAEPEEHIELIREHMQG